MKKEANRREKATYFLSGVAAAVLAAALLYFVYMIIPVGSAPAKPDTAGTVRKTKAIQRLIDRYYLGTVDEQAETDMIFAGQVAALQDQYSRYYTASQFRELQNRRQGEYTGIGITFAQQTSDGAMIVLDVVEGSPAEQAGIRIDDILLEVDGKPTDELSTSEVVELIRAREGEEIRIVLERGDSAAPLTVSVVPGSIESVTVTSEMLAGSIGLIRISQFARITVDQYRDAFEQLQKQGMKRMILDLRGNGGGLVDSACSIAEMILPEGVIVYEEDKNGKRTDHNGSGAEGFDYPLAVLVDENTASAAEILTGAIQDYGVGTVIGTQTFGKGIVQNVFHLYDGSVVQLTVTHYYTPNGNDIHEKGITPDVVAGTDENVGAADPVLDEALKVLNQL